MKKINFIIALSLLCCSYESMGLAPLIKISTNLGIKNTASYPMYIAPMTNIKRLAGVSLPNVGVTEQKCPDKILNGSKFALIEVTDKHGKNQGGNSCGYNALHTNRINVYDALVRIFHPARWTEDIQDENSRRILSRMLRGVTNDYEHVDDEYQPQIEWNTVNRWFQTNIRDGGDVMDQNLALLVCYIRGENLAVVNQNHVGEPIINNPRGITRYLYNSGGHWQELRPYNQQ